MHPKPTVRDEITVSVPVVGPVANRALDGNLLRRPGEAFRPELRWRRIEVLLE